MPFKKLDIIEPILKAVNAEGYETPSPIQEHAIPILLSGKDIMGSAQTGTGKTAAFAIPILQNIMQKSKRDGIKALILTPTRELAMQIKESFDNYGKYLPLKTVVIFGGVKQKSQVDKIRRGCDILVATPGRLLDLMNQYIVKLHAVEYFVLDEADRMLDMGFIRDVKKIVAKVPNKRQTMLFSATLPKSIVSLADAILTNPERVSITPVETTLDTIQQTVFYVDAKNKIRLLLGILKNNDYTSVLVFTRTKRNANTVAKHLFEKKISAVPIHGNKSQSARTTALKEFKAGNVRVLVATDLAARGLDIEDLSLVINYNLPEVPETYIHRIGRTGRANKNGISMSFCSEEEVPLLQAIQKHISMYIPVDETHPYHSIFEEKAEYTNKNSKSKSNNSKKLSVEHQKIEKAPVVAKKSDSKAFSEKIRHSQPKKKKLQVIGTEKKKGWAKAKPKSKSYGPRSENSSTTSRNNSSKNKNYSRKNSK
ncbi:MAG: DEAD/DEAH box helicase [Tenericutes bacterium]|nr:DEAD/DEAH box helicase [Mycoplasmatota bacterium]